MNEAYYIRGWKEHYEVSADGRVAKPDQKLRATPLKYVRLRVNGHSQRAEYRRLERLARTSTRMEGTWAVWCKLLEMAANQERQYRGWILTERQAPATAEDIAFFTGFRLKTIRTALELLSHPQVAWIELRPFDGDCADNRGLQQNSADNCETPRTDAEAFINETDNRTDTKTDSLTKTDTDTEQQTAPSDSGDFSKVSGGSDRSSGIQSGSGSNAKNLNPELFAQRVALELKLSAADRTQLQADLRCFRRAAEAHIVPGHLGDPTEAAERCYAKARGIASDRGVHQRRRARVWVAWLKGELKKKGHQWGE